MPLTFGCRPFILSVMYHIHQHARSLIYSGDNKTVALTLKPCDKGTADELDS